MAHYTGGTDFNAVFEDDVFDVSLDGGEFHIYTPSNSLWFPGSNIFSDASLVMNDTEDE